MTVSRNQSMLAVTQVGMGATFYGATAPAGWLFCAGQAVSRTTYAALFAVIGTIHGAGDGSTTFNVPDERGRTSFGADAMGGTAANRLTSTSIGHSATLGSSGGDELAQAHSHTASDSGHNHGYTAASSYAGYGGTDSTTRNIFQAATAGATNAASANITVASALGGGSQNIPPHLVVNKIIYAGA